MRHLDFLRRFPFKDNWMKELGSEVAGCGKESQQTQPKTKNPIVRTGRPVLSEQQSGSSVQEIENVSNLAAKAPMKEQEDLFSSCVPVSVKRSDQDKDADENVDADHVRTGRPVESEQSIGLFTQREEIDIDFRVSGLPHAIVKQAENFRVREGTLLSTKIKQLLGWLQKTKETLAELQRTCPQEQRRQISPDVLE